MANPTAFYVEAIRNLLTENPVATYAEIMDYQVAYYYEKLIKPGDQKLLDIAFDQNLNQAKLSAFLEAWDIEAVGSEKALLLSYVKQLRPDLDFGCYTGPRLVGLLKFYRFSNLKLIAQYTQLVRELNHAGIEPMILKGGAMKFLRPNLSRTMGDIDILVRNIAEYERCKKIVKSLGFTYVDNEHSIDVHEPGKQEGLLDIHVCVEMCNKYDFKIFNQKVFATASHQTIFGTTSYLPSVEDLFFFILANLARNLRDKTSIGGVLYALFDLDYLRRLRPTFDWQCVREQIQLTQTEPQIYLAMKFIEKLVPTFWGEEVLLSNQLELAVNLRCKRDLFFALYVEPYKVVCKKLKFGRSLKSWRAFKYYCSQEIPHFFLKRIYKSDRLIALFLAWKKRKGAHEV